MQYWSDHHERIYWIFLWESGFRKGVFFITYIWCISFASATQGMISYLHLDIRNTEAGWTISPFNSMSLIFYTEIFQVTREIFPIGFSHIVPIKLLIKPPESFSDFQNHSLSAVKSVMISLSWVHQFPIQHIFFLPGKGKYSVFPLLGWNSWQQICLTIYGKTQWKKSELWKKTEKNWTG